MPTSDTVVVERRINASPEIVFSYFTDRDRWLQWKGIAGSVDPVLGGKYRVTVTGDDSIVAGSFLAIEPPHRIVFSWGWEGEAQPVPPGSTIVEVTLVPEGDETLVTVTHRDLPADAMAPHAEGWNHYLDRLAMRAAGQDPGPDAWVGRHVPGGAGS